MEDKARIDTHKCIPWILEIQDPTMALPGGCLVFTKEQERLIESSKNKM